MAVMHVSVITPEGTVFDHRAKAVDAQTTDGGITILPGHIPIIVPLAIGELRVTRVTDSDDDKNYVAINGGIMEVQGNQVNIIANTAERSRDIDLDRAELAKKAAEELMAEARDQKNLVEFNRARVSLAKAINRIGVSKKRL
ncbi:MULTISPECIES: F0F1 ATP synthase subunit epsilon [unclassified Jeotgalibaca]|uniref:F0F1 ATP synthase subunit epsilon n=1 Tax=unclassified Jeotgalibaca TaxID=2621505 RepID=UPI003FD0641F